MRAAVLQQHNAYKMAAVIGEVYHRMSERARDMRQIYLETPTRKSHRQLIDAAGQIEGAEIEVTFVKNDGEYREMRCRSIGPDSDYTKRYVTVYDIEKEGFRRIPLDAILDIKVMAGVGVGD